MKAMKAAAPSKVMKVMKKKAPKKIKAGKASTKAVLATHVGSLPRPAWLVPIVRGEQEPPADYAEKLHQATIEVMQKQLDAGLYEINDGELGRRDYVTAARQRMS